jgi:hypothetical protein
MGFGEGLMNNSSFSRRALIAAACTAAVSSATVWAAKPAKDVPFSLDKRPQPKGEDLAVLLPLSVGPFKRDALPGGAKASSDEDLNVTYRSGADEISFGFSIPESPEDAHEAIKVTRDEARASKVPMKDAKYSVGTEPSFFHAHDFISWSRGRYFFYAKGSSPAALARFMAVFPY